MEQPLGISDAAEETGRDIGVDTGVVDGVPWAAFTRLRSASGNPARAIGSRPT